MTLKLGGFNISTFTGESNLGVTLLDKKNSTNGQDKFPVPSKLLIQTSAGEDPVKLHERMLREAASQAGLDGTEQQEAFVKKYASGIKFSDARKDPSPLDGLNVKPGEIKTETATYTLEQSEIDSLKLLQKEYVAANNKLHPGKSYQSAEASNGRATAKQAANDEAQQRARLNQLLRDAQILPTGVGTPSKLRDLKHITVALPEKLAAGLSNEDHALLAYLQKSYGTGNLQGDNIKEILDLSKKSGVRAENLKIENGTAEFDVTVENLLKMHTAYIGVQTKTNAEIEIFQTAADNTVASRFMRGVFEGAWETAKANGEMLADPIGTATKIAETIEQLAQIDPVLLAKAVGEMVGNAPELLQQAGTAISNTKVADAAQGVGKLVGAASVELMLGKGAGMALKGLSVLSQTKSGMLLLRQINSAATKTKEAIGSFPIPVKATEIVLTDGSKIKLPFGEVKRLDEIIMQMKASSSEKLEMLAGGSGAAGKQMIKETAESGLTEKAQSGMKHLKGEIPKEVMAQAKEQLVTLNVARTELMTRMNNLIANGNLLPDTKNILQRLKNSLQDHLKQDDLVGALRDIYNKPVVRSGDGYVYDHMDEVQKGLKSLDNAKEFLVDELKHKPKGSTEFVHISENIDAIKEMRRRVETFLEAK